MTWESYLKFFDSLWLILDVLTSYSSKRSGIQPSAADTCSGSWKVA